MRVGHKFESSAFNYKLEDLIGDGGYGRVFEATATSKNEPKDVKKTAVKIEPRTTSTGVEPTVLQAALNGQCRRIPTIFDHVSQWVPFFGVCNLPTFYFAGHHRQTLFHLHGTQGPRSLPAEEGTSRWKIHAWHGRPNSNHGTRREFNAGFILKFINNPKIFSRHSRNCTKLAATFRVMSNRATSSLAKPILGMCEMSTWSILDYAGATRTW